MPIDKQLIQAKLYFLNTQVSKIDQMKFTIADLRENEDTQDLLAFRMQQGVETSIDIATHIVSSLDMARKDTAKDAFLLLGKKNIIDKSLADRMGKAADFRNRVVHGYNDFDFEVVYHTYKEDVSDIKEFGSQILKYING